eukprot:3757053-Rhodomonas_salina.1
MKEQGAERKRGGEGGGHDKVLKKKKGGGVKKQTWTARTPRKDSQCAGSSIQRVSTSARVGRYHARAVAGW